MRSTGVTVNSWRATLFQWGVKHLCELFRIKILLAFLRWGGLWKQEMSPLSTWGREKSKTCTPVSKRDKIAEVQNCILYLYSFLHQVIHRRKAFLGFT